jgi:hypothetical protein
MIKKLIKELLDKVILECEKNENKERIQEKVLSPMIDFIIEKIKPYIFGMSIFLVVLVILIISILLLIVFK